MPTHYTYRGDLRLKPGQRRDNAVAGSSLYVKTTGVTDSRGCQPISSAPIAVPTGGIQMWGAGDPATNWEVCTGDETSQNEYAALFEVISQGIAPAWTGSYPKGRLDRRRIAPVTDSRVIMRAMESIDTPLLTNTSMSQPHTGCICHRLVANAEEDAERLRGLPRAAFAAEARGVAPARGVWGRS